MSRGHIRKRGKNSYSIALSLGYDPVTGKRRRQWTSIKGTRRDAERKLAELLVQYDNGTLIKPSKTTVTDYLREWVADNKSNLSPTTYQEYSRIVERYFAPELGAIQLTKLSPIHLQHYYAKKQEDGLKAQTVRHHHMLLHRILRAALKAGLVARNVTDAVDSPRPTRIEMRVWDANEMAIFLEAAKTTAYHSLFYLACYTGLRLSELLGLRWSDIDLLLGQLYINRGLHQLKDGSYVFTQPKSAKSRRMVSLSPSTIGILREHRALQSQFCQVVSDEGLVFCRIDGHPLRPNTISRAWTTLTERYGVPRIRFHDARHTHATLMLKAGVHPKVVQERLGHSTIAVTLDTYSHVTPGLQEAAARQFDEVAKPSTSEGLGGKLVANLP